MSVSAYDPHIPGADPVWVRIERHRRLADLLSMRRDAVLINTARGGIVEEPALASVLREGRLGGAAIDAFAREPLTVEAAAIFAGCRNHILTPHVADITEESNLRVSLVTARNLRSVLRGGT